MAKKLRFQEPPTRRNRRRPGPREPWVFEPLDAVLLALIVLAVLWLQWLLPEIRG